jgi:hypothetical protein
MPHGSACPVRMVFEHHLPERQLAGAYIAKSIVIDVMSKKQTHIALRHLCKLVRVVRQLLPKYPCSSCTQSRVLPAAAAAAWGGAPDNRSLALCFLLVQLPAKLASSCCCCCWAVSEPSSSSLLLLPTQLSSVWDSNTCSCMRLALQTAVPAAAAAGLPAACSEAQPEKEWFDGMLCSCSRGLSNSKVPQS